MFVYSHLSDVANMACRGGALCSYKQDVLSWVRGRDSRIVRDAAEDARRGITYMKLI